MADREGILIIDEIPAVSLNFMGTDDDMTARMNQCQQQLRELVTRDKNHPCVIMWSVANEPIPAAMSQLMGVQAPDGYDDRGKAFLSTLIDLAHELDSSRPATLVGVMQGPADWVNLADVMLINRYYGWYRESGQLEAGAVELEAELDELAQFNKPLIISEFGADTVAGMHSQPPRMFTEEYQTEFVRMYLDIADTKAFVIGMHIWNFADFQVTQSIMRVNGMNLKGVFTRAREPKMVAHMLRERWNG